MSAPFDLFSTVDKMLARAPVFTNVSIGFNFRPMPKGFDGTEKVVCHYMIDATVERDLQKEEDSTAKERTRKKSELTALQSQKSSTDGSFVEDLEESNPFIDERGPSSLPSLSSSSSRDLRTSVVFPRATYIPRPSSSSDASLRPKSSKKKGTPIVVTLPGLQKKKSSEKAVKDNLMKELAAVIKNKVRNKMDCRKTGEAEVDLTTEEAKCRGN